MKLAIASGAVLAISLMLPVHAQTIREPAPSGAAPLTQAERLTTEQFLNKAWNINQFEIQAGQEAKNKASSGFQDFAQMLVTDHTKMNDELKSATQKSGLQLPTKLDSQQQANLDQLKSSAERSFDKQFRAQQINGHREALKIFQSYASNGDNADLRSFAQNAVATLQKHLDQAEKLREPGGVM